MPTRRIYLERILTLNLYRASGEENGPDDVTRDLRSIGLTPRVLRHNPITDDAWTLALEFVSRHGAKMGAALMGVFVMWLKQKRGRRIEIERHGLKVKVATVRELERTLEALQNYDDVKITVKKARSRAIRANKRAVRSRRHQPRKTSD